MITSKRKAKVLASALFFIGIAILIFTDAWWPGIMLAVGLPLALKQSLTGKTYDMMITLLVFLGTFITVQFDISWRVFLPILFSIGAVYILLREFFTPDPETEVEKEEDVQHEIDEK